MVTSKNIVYVLLLVGAIIGMVYLSIIGYMPGMTTLPPDYLDPTSPNYMKVTNTTGDSQTPSFSIQFHHQKANSTYSKDIVGMAGVSSYLSLWRNSGIINQYQYDAAWTQINYRPEPTVSLTVAVRDSVTGSPIQGASVSCDDVDEVTDSSGECVITGLRPGTYTANLIAEGYRPASQTVNIGTQDQMTIGTLQPLNIGIGQPDVSDPDLGDDPDHPGLGTGDDSGITDGSGSHDGPGAGGGGDDGGDSGDDGDDDTGQGDSSGGSASKSTTLSDVAVLIMIGIVSSILAWFITVALGMYIPALLTPAGLSISTSAFGVVIFYVMAVIFGLV